MSERGSRLERFFAGALDIGTGSAVHPAELLQRVHTAAEASVRDGVIANAYTLAFDDANTTAFLPHRSSLVTAIERMLEDTAATRSLRRLAPWRIEFATQTRVEGGVSVAAEFRNVHAGGPAVSGATRAIRRQRGLFLRVEGGDRIAITHTPFSIGRARECDLTLLDMAVSRQHAVIEATDDGELVVRDQGSRNKISVDDAAVAELPLRQGTAFRLGGTTLTFEETHER